ncbi:uncharacterized protein N7483_000017 [Penicillium malachiteum]|uniref:uncharacterized protein n=1 Tax=Penicillium malachiteum TaxID=1324776 RepID=UPI002548AC3C|nr:uncharacterized protein N7483_000017 [Penicillium malachiteum]KAJ5734892.1 hypothetical protein N7483_000017 [Penicillium malachiteum]
MASWTHLIRFIAVEDSEIYLGQLVDSSQDIGLDSLNGKEISAHLIEGNIFDGTVTDQVFHVKRVSLAKPESSETHIKSPCRIKYFLNQKKAHTDREFEYLKLLSHVSREQCDYIRCLGLNYADHARECNLELPNTPIVFTKPRSALSGPYPAVINVPKCAQDGTSDYEAELCLVIGKTGRDIPEEKALEHVLGYTASNDVSARGLQRANAQWSFSKGLDGSCPIVLVALSIITDPQALTIKAIYNGATVQDGHTRDMIFDVKKQISYLSQGTTLEAGTIILTGTPAGIGCL